MVTGRPLPALLPPTRPGAGARGFTFVEILVVMAMLAVLAGLGIGLLQSLGHASLLLQSREIVRETAFACKASSNGGTHATFVLREGSNEGGPILFVDALAARPVLTADFETLDFVSLAYPVKAVGGAQVDPDPANGYVGRALKLAPGGYLEVAPQAAFAMSEGLEIDAWVRPDPTAARATVLAGQDPDARGKPVYALRLVRQADGGLYDVEFVLSLVPEDASGRVAGVEQTFVTTGGAVRSDGGWSQVRARWDGREATILVNGLQRPLKGAVPPRAPSGAPASPAAPKAPEPAKRIFVPPSGSVLVTVSDPAASFRGWIDALVLRGMFRSAEFSRELHRGVAVRGKLPIRAEYVNGRLDPTIHKARIEIVLLDEANAAEPPWKVVLGLDGDITTRLDEAVPARRTP